MWLSKKQADELVAKNGSPLFVYSRKLLKARADELMGLQLPFGHTVRYAAKTNPHPTAIEILNDAGLHFDASSAYEAADLLKLGIPGDRISLSTQQTAHNLQEILDAGVNYVATSMHQLGLFISTAKQNNGRVALRVNPPVGFGHNNRLTTAGRNSGFGLWHEYVEDALKLARSKKITIDRVHRSRAQLRDQ